MGARNPATRRASAGASAPDEGRAPSQLGRQHPGSRAVRRESARAEGRQERAGGRGRAGPAGERGAPSTPSRRRPRLPTFQVTAGGRREPLLGFAAHQLQADLQHGRAPAASGSTPPLAQRLAQARLPRTPRGPGGPASPPPRRPARPPMAAAASPTPLRTRQLTKGPSPAARPAPPPAPP